MNSKEAIDLKTKDGPGGQKRRGKKTDQNPSPGPLIQSVNLSDNVFDGHFSQLLALFSEAALIVQNDIIQESNQSFVEMSGCDREELVGSPLTRFVDPLVEFSNWRQRQGVEILKFDNTSLIKRSGQRSGVTVKAAKIIYQGNPAELLLIDKPTDPLETTDDIQKARKLESIAALSGGIAHDYNNLLTVIIGNISLIQSCMDDTDIHYRMLSEAYEASLIAKNLTQKLITFSKGGAPMKETAAVSPLVKNATEFTLSGSNIRCQFKLPENLYLVEIDKTQIGQAIHNLVMNAREAMPAGGTIAVCAENTFIAEKTHALKPGKHVRISIADQGMGIAPQNLDKIFDPYFSTKQRGSQKGMGLGLSICHSIIKKHSGDVVVESRVGAGATVSILLPASAEQKIEKKSPPRVPHEKPVPGKGRVLVMDDEMMIIRLTGLILHRLGYDADFAAEGSEAIEKYQQAFGSRHPFDAVILDLTVRGGMGGKETLKNLIAIDPEVKAIVASGYSDDPVIRDYPKYGFKGVVIKPFSIYELSENLSDVLSG